MAGGSTFAGSGAFTLPPASQSGVGPTYGWGRGKTRFSPSFRKIEQQYRDAGHARGVHSGAKGVAAFDRYVDWNGEEVLGVVYKDLQDKMGRAVKMIRTRTVKNITKRVVLRPVTGREIRSKPGMFPYFDTGALAHSIRGLVREYQRGSWEGYVYTTVEYALYLERDLDRSFLLRTFKENEQNLRRLFGKRIPIDMSSGVSDPDDRLDDAEGLL